MFLVAAIAAEESIVVQAEFDPNTFRVGDVAFGRVTIENRGEHAIENVQTRYASICGSAFYTLSFAFYPYSFRFDYAPSASGQGKEYEQTMQPGEKWIVDYPLLAMPEPKYFGDQFWSDLKRRPGQVNVRLYGELRGKISLKGSGSLYFRERPEREMEFLRGLFKRSHTLDDGSFGKYDLHRTTAGVFGLDVCDENLTEGLIAFEEQLSLGTLRDIVKATRLMRVLDSPKDPETRDATIVELLKWLGTLPTIQREVFAIELDAYIRQRDLGGGGERLDPKLHPEYADLLRGVIQYMPESAYGSTTFRQDHLRYLEGIGK
jgi:hypothetical protein